MSFHLCRRVLSNPSGVMVGAFFVVQTHHWPWCDITLEDARRAARCDARAAEAFYRRHDVAVEHWLAVQSGWMVEYEALHEDVE